MTKDFGVEVSVANTTSSFLFYEGEIDAKRDFRALPLSYPAMPKHIQD